MRAPTNIPARARSGLYVRSESALRIRAERVRRIVARMQKEMPWLEPSDRPAMKGWAELEILSATVFAWLVQMNVINGQGEPRRLLNEHRQLKLAQLAYERELGMTPASRMALRANGTSAALDLAEIAEPVSERVIEVGRSRGKTADVEDDGGGDGSKPRDRTDNKPAGV